MVGFKDCNAYWEEVVRNYVECSEHEITINQTKEVAQQLLDSDYIWDTIYSEIYNILKEKGVI